MIAGLPTLDGELAGAGAEEVAADADVIAEVEELVEGEGVLADVVFADVDLEALAALLELREAGLALNADGHDASGDRDVDRRVRIRVVRGHDRRLRVSSGMRVRSRRNGRGRSLRRR